MPPTCLIRVVAMQHLPVATPAPAAADEITWLTMEFPPFFIHEGKVRAPAAATALIERLGK